MTPLDRVAEAAGHKIALSGAGVSAASGIWGWLAENHQVIASIGVIAGIIVGVTGLIIQARAIKRRDRRETEEARRRIEAHEAAMARMRDRH